MAYTVYKHTAPNGKIYIGITSKDPEVRWKSGYGHNRHFLSAIKKYGWENIKSEIIFSNLTKEDACDAEIQLIKELKSTNPKFGYNISTGGECGRIGVIASDESREKMRLAKIGRKLSDEHKKKISESGKGRKFSEETREKIRIANTGKRHTEESKRKMSESQKGRKQSEEVKEKKRRKMLGAGNPFYGKKHSDRSKQIISAKHSKRVMCVETGAVFQSARAASTYLGLNESAVSGAIIGKSKTAGGYNWKYCEEATE